MSGFGAWRWYRLAKDPYELVASKILPHILSWLDCWPSCPILPLTNKIQIVSNIGWSLAISAWNCHLIHYNDIGLLSTAAMKRLHWSLFCQKVLSKTFRTNFPSTFCKRTSFQSTFFNVGEFSLGPVFLIPVIIHKNWQVKGNFIQTFSRKMLYETSKCVSHLFENTPCCSQKTYAWYHSRRAIGICHPTNNLHLLLKRGKYCRHLYQNIVYLCSFISSFLTNFEVNGHHTSTIKAKALRTDVHPQAF